MSWILGLLIGLMAGYGVVSGDETGKVVAVLVLVVLPVLYYRQGRLPDIGWLFIGLGGLPIVMLGPTLFASLDDGGTGVEAGTWPIFVAAAMIAIAGLLVLLALGRRAGRGV